MIAVAGALAFALAQPYLRFVTVGGSPGQMMWLRLGVAGVIVLALGNAGVTSVAFLGDLRSLRSIFAEVRPGDPAFLTADEEAALSWMRERSPRDAAFLRSPRPFGTEPILILGWRRLYVGMAESFYNEIQFRSPGHLSAPPAVWAELKRREALQRTVFSERSLAPDSLALLRDFPRPLYIWWGTRLGGGRALADAADAGGSAKRDRGASHPGWTSRAGVALRQRWRRAGRRSRAGLCSVPRAPV